MKGESSDEGHLADSSWEWEETERTQDSYLFSAGKFFKP